jgi:hypothetical protein
MKKILFALIFLCFAATSFATDFGDPRVNTLYSSILEETFSSDKAKLASRLGSLKTPEAKNALLMLVKNKDSWNKEAATAGLFYFNDKDVCNLLLNIYIDDHMLKSELEDGFIKNWKTYFPVIKDAYNTQLKEETRIKLIRLINAKKDKNSEGFFKSVINNATSKERVEAFKLLTESYTRGNDKYFRDFIEDAYLRSHVLDYILDHGDKEDLPIFTSVLDKQEKKFTIKALVAVYKWETPEKKEQIFYDYISSENPEQFYPALYSSVNVKSERIMSILCKISEKGVDQQIRMLASLKLINYDNKKIIPYLKRFHKETYIPGKADYGKVIMAHITLGMTVAFDYFSEKKKEKEFNKAKEKIAEKLIEMLSE